MSKQLKQVINLSKKTGDRVIVFDNSEPESSFVVMALDQYEELALSGDKSLTSKKIVDKIDNKENNRNNSGKNGNGNGWKIPEQVKEESED
jgi:hypothetical protein